MAKGYEQHQHTQGQLSWFGKDLVRRAGSHCELCDAAGEKLFIHEVPPIPTEPDFEHCILICATCKEQLEKPKKVEPKHWRCLAKAMWSPVTAVQVTAVNMLHRLANSEEWAAELLEELYLEPEVQEWIEQVTPAGSRQH